MQLRLFLSPPPQPDGPSAGPNENESTTARPLFGRPSPPFAYASLEGRPIGWLDEQRLDAVLEGVDQVLQLGRLVRQDGAGDDGARDAAGPPQGDLGGDEDVGDVLLSWCFGGGWGGDCLWLVGVVDIKTEVNLNAPPPQRDTPMPPQNPHF